MGMTLEDSLSVFSQSRDPTYCMRVSLQKMSTADKCTVTEGSACLLLREGAWSDC